MMKKALIAALVLVASGPLGGGLEAQQTSRTAALEGSRPQIAAAQAPNREEPGREEAAGQIEGVVVDPNGAVVPGARVTITSADGAVAREETKTGNDGEFSFDHLRAGAFQISVAAPGFAPKTVAGVTRGKEALSLGPIALSVGEVNEAVTVSPGSIAQEQIRMQEKQRLFGVIPNYYVNYDRYPEPLSARQKSELGLKFTLDPVSFLVVGAIAGAQQATDTHSGYGQGAKGYAKRYGAAYATFFDGVLIGKILLPALLKQDPRYLYKGTGAVGKRAVYAISNSVACKGDNGRWQPNYSSIIGDLAAGGLANAYIPGKDRNGAGDAFKNAGISIAGDAAGNLVQEFLFRKVTSHSSKH